MKYRSIISPFEVNYIFHNLIIGQQQSSRHAAQSTTKGEKKC